MFCPVYLFCFMKALKFNESAYYVFQKMALSSPSSRRDIGGNAGSLHLKTTRRYRPKPIRKPWKFLQPEVPTCKSGVLFLFQMYRHIECITPSWLSIKSLINFLFFRCGPCCFASECFLFEYDWKQLTPPLFNESLNFLFMFNQQ